MVHLTRIYTRTGDAGQTRLSDMSLTDKTDPRVAAYGDVDEANSAIGVALATGELPTEIGDVLRHIQNEMFDVGADLSNPVTPNPEFEPLRVESEYIDRLEAWCDQFTAGLPTLRSFILPGGSLSAAHLHIARTVTRRAERSAWLAVQQHPDEVNLLAVKYLNRLSDLLFILTRAANGTAGDVLWVPGGERNHQKPQKTRSTDDQEKNG